MSKEHLSQKGKEGERDNEVGASSATGVAGSRWSRTYWDLGPGSGTSLEGGLDVAKLPPHLQSARALDKNPAFANIFGPDFYVIDTFGRGSCFFHAIAEALCPQYDWVHNNRARESMGLRLRRSFVKYSNEQLYAEAMATVVDRIKLMQKKNPRAPSIPSIPSYAVFQRKLGTPSVWADLVLISYISHVFNLNVVFWDDVSSELYYGASRFEARHDVPTIFVNWHNRRHFELIVKIDESKGKVERQFFYDRHKTLIDRVMRAYNGAM